MRTFLYKMISDQGGAPCAPRPHPGKPPLLTLAICKPAIRRSAEAGDWILGLTSRALEQRQGYPAGAVIWMGVVSEALDARTYYAERSGFRARPDCIYRFDPASGELRHDGGTLHRAAEIQHRDIGRAPWFRNGRVLLCSKFRYFGAEALLLTAKTERLLRLALELGQGHRVLHGGSDDAVDRELEVLFTAAWQRETRWTPRRVVADTYERQDTGALARGGKGYAGRAPRPM